MVERVGTEAKFGRIRICCGSQQFYRWRFRQPLLDVLDGSDQEIFDLDRQLAHANTGRVMDRCSHGGGKAG